MDLDDIIAELNRLADPEKVAFKEKKYNITASNCLGVMQSDLRLLAKKIPKDDKLALKLFDSGIYEARLLCSKVFNPKNLTLKLVEKWTPAFNNWEICDSFSMGIYARSPLALPIIYQWAERVNEFEKRTSFATIAGYCTANKKEENSVFLSFLPLIETASTDNRLYVKKAVNWALRSIGKRNVDLNKSAITLSKNLSESPDKAAKWIGSHALKELQLPNVRMSDYPRALYRK